MQITEIIASVGWVSVIGAIVWLIRLEGAVKANAKDIMRLSSLEPQANSHEVRIKQRDEEMANLKRTLDEFREKLSDSEKRQIEIQLKLAKIDDEIEYLLKKGANRD